MLCPSRVGRSMDPHMHVHTDTCQAQQDTAELFPHQTASCNRSRTINGAVDAHMTLGSSEVSEPMHEASM